MGSIPYLGSKISLISKSEIRYEGVLYTIDTKESTVALAKVRSFGTEDRPTDRPVAPREEIYEYIIFRASDIKDLHVCEPPKPQATLAGGLPNDPAIIQHSLTGHSSSSLLNPSPLHSSTKSLDPLSPPSLGGPSTSLPPRCPAIQVEPLVDLPKPNYYNSSKADSPSATPSSSPAHLATSEAGVQVTPPQPPAPQPPHHLHHQQQQQNRDHRNQSASSSSNNNNNNRPMRPPPNHHHHQQHHHHHQQQPQQPRQGGYAPRGRGGGRSYRGGGGGGRRGAGHPLRFDREFDFEQANAEFKELETKLKMASLEDKPSSTATTTTTTPNTTNNESPTSQDTPSPSSPTVYYDRKKSFFDNISCDSLEQSKGKFQWVDWKKEKMTNVETFGTTHFKKWRRNNYHRYQRGYGQAGRGGAPMPPKDVRG